MPMEYVDANSTRTFGVPLRLFDIGTPAVTTDPTEYTLEAQVFSVGADAPDASNWTSTGVSWKATPFQLRGAKGSVYAALVTVNGHTNTSVVAGNSYFIAVKISAGSESIILRSPTVLVAT